MSFVDGNGLSAADVAAVTGGNGGFGTFGGDVRRGFFRVREGGTSQGNSQD